VEDGEASAKGVAASVAEVRAGEQGREVRRRGATITVALGGLDGSVTVACTHTKREREREREMEESLGGWTLT